jgi:hypothetical protein
VEGELLKKHIIIGKEMMLLTRLYCLNGQGICIARRNRGIGSSFTMRSVFEDEVSCSILFCYKCAFIIMSVLTAAGD